MYMEDRLSRFRAGVEDDPVAAVPEPLGLRHPVGLERHLGQQPGVGAGQRGQIRVVVPGDDQDMRRSLRVDIAKRDRAVTLSHSFRWDITRDDLAEEAVCHGGNRSLTGDNSPHMGPMPSSRTISLIRCELMARAPEVHGPAERFRLCTPGATPRPGHTRRDTHESFVGGRNPSGQVAAVESARNSHVTTGEPDAVPARPINVTDTLLAGVTLEPVAKEWDATQAVTEIYNTHYRSLVRLAVLLVRDVATAEEVVQDSFVAMHSASRRLRDSDKALSYLRQSVVNRSRSVLRHRVVVDRNAPKPAPDMPSAEQGALSLLERSAVIAALRTLPPRQREALVLKFYADLSEAQIAASMGISQGAVKSHTARGMASMRAVLEMQT